MASPKPKSKTPAPAPKASTLGDRMNDWGDWVPTIIKGVSPTCDNCVHLRSSPARICDAFPDGIPLVIWNGDNKHTTPFAGDHGIQFEAKKPAPKKS